VFFAKKWGILIKKESESLVFTGFQIPRDYYIGREVAPMTAYEIISIFIGILALLMSFGSLIVALLAFLDKRNKRK